MGMGPCVLASGSNQALASISVIKKGTSLHPSHEPVLTSTRVPSSSLFHQKVGRALNTSHYALRRSALARVNITFWVWLYPQLCLKVPFFSDFLSANHPIGCLRSGIDAAECERARSSPGFFNYSKAFLSSSSLFLLYRTEKYSFRKRSPSEKRRRRF